MTKRFTDTTIWKNQKWFKSLSADFKLAFFYIKDNCDHSGVWKIDCPDLMEYTSISSFSLDIFVSEVNADYDKISGEKIEKVRLKVFNQKYLWIVKFIEFQCKGKEDSTLNPYSPVINSALTLLDNYGILNEGLSKGYLTLSVPYTKGMLRTKDKDKDKERIKEGAETIKENNRGLNGKHTLEQIHSELKNKQT